MPRPIAPILAAVLLGLAAPGLATAKSPVPIDGEVTANVYNQFVVGTEAITFAHGSGTVSPLGTTSAELDFAIDVTTYQFEGNIILTAADGDRLFGTFEGGYISGVDFIGAIKFVGGTGQFARASGSATLTGYDIDGNVNNFSVSFDGSISY